MTDTGSPASVDGLPWRSADVESSVGLRFRRIVERYPDRQAVQCPLGTWSYAQLEAVAGRVARDILDTASDASPVLLHLDHDRRLICAMLGTILAGRGYVALDVNWPMERLAQIAREVGATTIVAREADSAVAGKLVEDESARIYLDHVRPGGSASPLPQVGPEGLFAVFYSSGTTGRPKGSAQNHRKVLHRALVESRLSRISPADRIALTYGCAFGASVVDIFNALLNGASLHLFDVRARGLHRLAEWVNKIGISYLHLPAALFRDFSHCVPPGTRMPRVREIVASGRLYRSDMERMRPHFAGDCMVVSRLSSSEGGMITRAAFRFDSPPESDVVPCGKPIDGKSVTLLDDAGGAVASGEVGEVVVRSKFLSTAYFARPDLSADRFQDAEPDGTRTLRTGDLARWRADGLLEWVGRKDDTVKVRGYRLELSAVEDALFAIDGIRDAAVLPATEEPGDVELTAYLVLSEPSPVSAILETLRASLPEFMVPSRTVMVEALPLTLNGKVDRRALRAMGSAPERPYQIGLKALDGADADGTESKLLAIWAELLGPSVCGPEDDFFLHGGHSLLAQRAIARIYRDFGLDLPPSTIFAHPTPRGLAVVLDAKLGRGSSRT